MSRAREKRIKNNLVELVHELAIEYGDFTLSSGVKSHFYIDMRKVTLSSDGLDLITQGMHTIVTHLIEAVEAVGGPSLGADPIVGALLAKHIPYLDRGFLVRKDVKGHGMQRLIEGNLHVGDHAFIVEDVVTTGGSIQHALKAVAAAGATVSAIAVVLDREPEKNQALYAHFNKRYFSLLTIKDLRLAPAPAPVITSLPGA